MKKIMSAKTKSAVAAVLFFGFAGVMGSDADEAPGLGIKEVTEHHISVIQTKHGDDLSILSADKDLRSACQALARDYTDQMYGDIISIIKKVSKTGNSSYPIHDRVAPFGEAYVDADCPIGQMIWLTHQKRAAITYVVEEFVPDIIAAFAGGTA